MTLIFTFVNYIWNSQGIATTTLVADALNRPSADSKHPPHVEAGRVLASSLMMAAAMGAMVCVFLQLFGPRLLQLTGAAPELMDPALAYLRIRALATPAAFGETLGPEPPRICPLTHGLLVIMPLSGGQTEARTTLRGNQPCLLPSHLPRVICHPSTGIVVSQATLLAQRKSLLPCLVIAASALVNLGLDVFLIVNCGMGVAGAAWATLASQYLAMGLMFTILNSRRSQVCSLLLFLVFGVTCLSTPCASFHFNRHRCCSTPNAMVFRSMCISPQ